MADSLQETKGGLPPAEEDKTEACAMSFWEHLEELRGRILFAFWWFVAFSVAGWYGAPWVLSAAKSDPSLKDIQIILIRPPEAFLARMKIALILGFLLTLPVIVWQTLAFVLPGLKTNEKKWVLRLVPFSVLLFYGGAAFSVVVMLPMALQFFLVGMAKGLALPQISLEEYVNFISAMALLGGAVFQLPVLLLFLSLTGIVSSEMMARYRRHAIVLIFIIAALASPPDPFSQVVVAIPLWILFELCIILSRIAGR